MLNIKHLQQKLQKSLNQETDKSLSNWLKKKRAIINKEEKAESILKNIENTLLNGRKSRMYNRIDLIRFAKLSKENHDIPNYELVKIYNAKHPEKTSIERLNNLADGLNMPELKNIQNDA